LDVSKCFFGNVVVVEVKEFHGLQDDLKSIPEKYEKQ